MTISCRAIGFPTFPPIPDFRAFATLPRVSRKDATMTTLIRHTEKLDTLCIRLARPADIQARRQEIVAQFEAMCTDIGKIASPIGRPEWSGLHLAIHNLRWAAVGADEAKVATFHHVGAELALTTALHAFAAVLGYRLDDAADADARGAVEGVFAEAAE